MIIICVSTYDQQLKKSKYICISNIQTEQFGNIKTNVLISVLSSLQLQKAKDIYVACQPEFLLIINCISVCFIKAAAYYPTRTVQRVLIIVHAQ